MRSSTSARPAIRVVSIRNRTVGAGSTRNFDPGWFFWPPILSPLCGRRATILFLLVSVPFLLPSSGSLGCLIVSPSFFFHRSFICIDQLGRHFLPTMSYGRPFPNYDTDTKNAVDFDSHETIFFSPRKAGYSRKKNEKKTVSFLFLFNGKPISILHAICHR